MQAKWMVMLAGLVAGTAQAALPAAIGGPWYNPAQPGHGLSIDLVPDEGRAVLLWHVYDPAGAPLTLYVEADVAGRRLVGTAYAPTGMRFGRFDPAEVALPVWGSVSVDFADCSHAELAWDARDPAYGSGAMAIERLIALPLDGCVLPPRNELPVGLVRGDTVIGLDGPGAATLVTEAEGIIDGEGRLWALERRDAGSGEAIETPGPGWVGARLQHVYRADPVAVEGTRVDMRGKVFDATWATQAAQASVGRLAGRWDAAGLQAAFEPDGAYLPDLIRQHWSVGAPAGVQLVAPVTPGDLAGTYALGLRSQFFSFPRQATIDGSGRFCLVSWPEPGGCDMAGRIGMAEGEQGLLDFELRGPAPTDAVYRGRGWLSDRDGVRELTLVGDDGHLGFALVATRAP